MLSSSTTGVSVYSAAAQYDGDELTSSSIGDIFGLFLQNKRHGKAFFYG
ncbi:MAG: hypothetical protein L6V88_10605 [Anaerotruncus sp.]|nr:MAG: hypothetical protein L6V88_10605 [Anaerotruncus sp.]